MKETIKTCIAAFICLIVLFLLPSLLANIVQADELFSDGGLGILQSADPTLAAIKTLTLGLQEDLWGPFKDRLDIGGWIDNYDNGGSSSAILATQLGFEVKGANTKAAIFFGPALISTTDQYLGGHFQFMTDLHYGLVDYDQDYIGLFLRHISSAGLSTPNLGQDSAGIELRMPFEF